MKPFTPLPWGWYSPSDEPQNHLQLMNTDDDGPMYGSVVYHASDWPVHKENAAYIVHAANNYPALVAALQKIEAMDAASFLCTVKGLKEIARAALHEAGETEGGVQ